MTHPDVTVVIPHFEHHEPLALTLEALNHQHYPIQHLQVVVADDGSERLPHRPDHVRYDLKIIRQEHEGFGLARARNLGATEADGDILVFLDSDMLPEPSLVAAHVDAVSPADWTVSIGHRLHVDAAQVSSEQVGRVLGDGGELSDLFETRGSEPVWRADQLRGTDDLTDDRADSYRLASGGNLSLWRDFYWDCGASDPDFRQWGGEDIEFAFRATQHGARFVYTRHARAWHQGTGTSPDVAERRSQAEQRPLLANRIADSTMRRSSAGRVYTVPHLAVSLQADNASAEELEVLIEGLLRHPLGCAVRVHGFDDRHRPKVLGRAFASDPRVSLRPVGGGHAERSTVSPAPFSALVTMADAPTAEALLAGVERLSRDPRVGVVSVGSRTAIYRQQLAARLIRRRGHPMSTEETVEALTDEYGAGQVTATSTSSPRPAGAPTEGADVLRDLWWRLSPTQRAFVEGAARSASRLRGSLRR